MDGFFCVKACKYDPSREFEVCYPASLDKPKDNAVMFVNEKNIGRIDVLDTVKECIIFCPVDADVKREIQEKNVVIESYNPRLSYCLFFRENGIVYLPQKESFKTVDGACIADTARIGENTVVMPLSYIGGEVEIGKNCYIGSGSRLVGRIRIGDNVIIRENTVLGADGLSTERDLENKSAIMPQFGRVVIEDDVQIGANCVIARGAIDDTTIRRGSKIDNSTFVSHNVTIGEDTFVVGETIFFGGSSVGDRSFVSGNTTVRNKVSIGNEAMIGMGSVVVKDVGDGLTVYGNPAHE